MEETGGLEEKVWGDIIQCIETETASADAAVVADGAGDASAADVGAPSSGDASVAAAARDIIQLVWESQMLCQEREFNRPKLFC